MNNHKITHLLLIALLCFGQLAASTHVAGHIVPHTQPHNHSELHQHNEHAHPHGHNNHSHTSDQYFVADKHKRDKDHIHDGNDCSIYHLFSNLSCTVPATQLFTASASRTNLASPSNDSHIASTSAKRQRIRAPPALS